MLRRPGYVLGSRPRSSASGSSPADQQRGAAREHPAGLRRHQRQRLALERGRARRHQRRRHRRLRGRVALGGRRRSADAGIVYVFLGHAGALPPTPTALDLGAASFTISGHAGEMLGFSITGDDINRDRLNDIAIGAPMAGAPSKTAAARSTSSSARTRPGMSRRPRCTPTGAHERPREPGAALAARQPLRRHWWTPTRASRWPHCQT